MTGRRRLLVSLFVLACGGEGPVVAQALFSSTDDVDRVRSSVTFDTLWAFGGPADTVLASPIMPRPDGAQGVVLFDVLNQAAYRIGSDGELLWSWGTKGEGPGELANVQALDVAPDGSVVLVDSGNLRVVRLSADGHLLGEARALGEGMVHSVAALSGGRLAVHSMRPLLAMWDGNDEDVAVVPAKLGGAARVAAPRTDGQMGERRMDVRVPRRQWLDEVPGRRVAGRLPIRRARGLPGGARCAERASWRAFFAHDEASSQSRGIAVRGRGHAVRPVQRQDSGARPVAGQVRRAVRGVLGNRSPSSLCERGSRGRGQGVHN